MNPAMIMALVQASPELLADAIILLQELTKCAQDLQAFMAKVNATTPKAP